MIGTFLQRTKWAMRNKPKKMIATINFLAKARMDKTQAYIWLKATQ